MRLFTAPSVSFGDYDSAPRSGGGAGRGSGAPPPHDPGPGAREMDVVVTHAGRIAREMADVLTLLQGHTSLARGANCEAGEARQHLDDVARCGLRAAALAHELAALVHVAERTLRTYDGAAPPSVHAADATAPTILVAEDEPMVAELTRRVLLSAGYEVVIAHDGQAACELIDADAGAYALVVSDIVMPRMSGLELARHLAHARPTLPVLLVSGYAEDGRRLSDETLAKTPFLAKPFKTSELLAAVRALCAHVTPALPATP